MSNLNKILKDSKIIVDGAKDTLTSNIVEAKRSNLIDLNDQQLQRICDIISVSLDESFQKTLPVFHNMIKKHVDS